LALLREMLLLFLVLNLPSNQNDGRVLDSYVLYSIQSFLVLYFCDSVMLLICGRQEQLAHFEVGHFLLFKFLRHCVQTGSGAHQPPIQ